ncbi:glycerol-1-phosphatase [Trichosporon asahii var. asahii CBS 8904]|uniref:Glycerol-1-phosphatase n=2 Tax=Trichosporon asahii var. asahii TaxID=189963 RepID=K1VG64_TRIAC|nr:glycerol-1-phosphatase [Trichosporon asahii var. asahii CBS 2479]EJT49331.1 glycerol-1-phosphatase [Trichosporon asahii var. asahii CBS 2479]EKC98056.1 glycerol-1-phosphatase [Trichosporon asahii var. asahii CBS 8904]
MSPQSVTVDAVLFDMDGTLLDSTPGVEATWEQYKEKYDLDLDEVLKHAHGMRTQDNMKNWCGIKGEEESAKEAEKFEGLIVENAKRLQDMGKTGLIILPGVKDILESLNTAPEPCWSIVTSARYKYASAALPTAAVPPHHHLVTANDVQNGKPNPEPYLKGAAKLGVDTKNCVVVEDAPSGIKAGVAAGAHVLAVCTSFPREMLEGLGAEWIVEDLTHVRAEPIDGRVKVTILD